MLKAKLVVVGGDAKAGEVNLKLPTTIGRGREASLTIPHPLVSRIHCELTERDGKLVVKDLGSLNGTFVNNQRIEGEELIEPEQLLTLGNVTFRAFYEVGVKHDVESLATATASADASNNLETVRQPEPKQPVASPAAPICTDDPSAELATETNDKETVYDNNKKSTDTDKDLSKIIEDSNEQKDEADNQVEAIASQVVIEDADAPSADKSVSVSALDDLEVGETQPAALSFAGGIDMGDDQPEKSKVDSFQLDLGDEPETGKDESKDSKLGSFLRKLPK